MSKFTYSKPSNSVQRTNKAWRNINVDDLRDNPEQGSYFKFDPFQHGWTDLASAGSNGLATLVIATAGQLVVNDANGCVQVDSNSTTDNQGATMFFPGAVVVPAADKLIVLKGVMRARDFAGGLQMFFGLCLSTLDTAPVTADAPAAGATDYIGLYTTGNTGTAGRVYFAAEDGGTQSLESDHVHTFLDGDTVTDGTEVVKFEIRINGLHSIELYVNGEEVEHAVDVAAIPEGTALRLVVSCLTSTTTDPIVELLPGGIELACVTMAPLAA